MQNCINSGPVHLIPGCHLGHHFQANSELLLKSSVLATALTAVEFLFLSETISKPPSSTGNESF